MKRVVIESPLAARDGWSMSKHIKYARECLADSLERGEAPIASHLLYPRGVGGPLDDGDEEQRHRGIYAGLAWAERADLAVFYLGMGESPGMQAARLFYRDHDIPTEDRCDGIEAPCRHCRMSGRTSGYPKYTRCKVCKGTGWVDPAKGCRDECCQAAPPSTATPLPRR